MTGRDDVDPSPSVGRSRAQRWLFLLVLMGVTARTAVVYLDEVDLAWEEARAAGRDQPDRAAAITALVTGAGIALAVLVLWIVTSRHQRRLRRMNEALRHAESQAATLQQLAGDLSRSLSGAEVGRALLRSLPALTGATIGAVAVLGESGDHLELVAARGYRPEQLEQLDRVPLEPGSALTQVVSTKEAAWLPSPLAWRHDPATALFAGDGWAAGLVPLTSDHVAGVLVLAQPSVNRFSQSIRSMLATVGTLAAQALDRGHRYDVEHTSAVAFQRAALPLALPDHPGVTLAARYRPATQIAGVGGDWYDAISLADGRLAVAVGDVVGHGVHAAATMGRLRTAMRALATTVPEPDALLRALDAQVPSIPDAMCTTMTYFVIDPVRHVAVGILAGHPPPLLLRASGKGELVTARPFPPLGIELDGPIDGQQASSVHVVDFGPGDTLLLYTDGVVERREESLDVGLGRLRVAGEALADLEPEELCDALLEALVREDEQRDDVALLAVRLH